MLLILPIILFYKTLYKDRDKILFFYINNILFKLLPDYGLVLNLFSKSLGFNFTYLEKTQGIFLINPFNIFEMRSVGKIIFSYYIKWEDPSI